MSKLNIQEKTKVLINGEEILSLSPKELLNYLLIYILDIKYSPLETLIENTKQIFLFVSQYCKETKKSSAGIVTRLKGFDRIKTRENFERKFYDTILSMEGLSSLHGFGVGNNFGDKLKRNPEKTRMTYEKK